MNTIWTDFVNFWENDVWSGLKKLFQVTVTNEVAALTPIAQTVVATIEADLKNVTNLSGAATVIGNVFTSVASQAEAAAVSAGAASLITVVSSALGNLLSSQSNAATPADTPTPPVAS